MYSDVGRIRLIVTVKLVTYATGGVDSLLIFLKGVLWLRFEDSRDLRVVTC